MAIRGVYLVRGQDYEPAFGVNDMFESYKYTKLDASKPEDKKVVEDEWVQSDDIYLELDGKKLPYLNGKWYF